MSRWAAWLVVGLIMGSAPLLGCLGPRAVEQTRSRYNEVIQKSNNEELLLNLVRLRHDENLGFLPVSGLTAQFELTAGLLGRGGVDRGGASNYGEGTLGFADRPTITFTPQRSPELTKALFSHIPLETLYLFTTSGSNLDVLFRLFVRNINGIENVSSRPNCTLPGSTDEALFQVVVEQIAQLQAQRKMVMALEDRQQDVADLPKIESASAQDLVRIKEAGLGLRSLGENKGYAFTKSTPTRVIRIAPGTENTPELRELEQLLHLKPGLQSYEIKDVPEGQLKNSEAAGERTQITLTTRSVLEVMYLLARGVSLPSNCQTIQSSVVETVAGVEDLFKVYYDAKRPHHAAIAVQYSEGWFYIKADDVRTKSSLVLFNELFRLQRIGIPEGPPILTLPVGR